MLGAAPAAAGEPGAVEQSLSGGLAPSCGGCGLTQECTTRSHAPLSRLRPTHFSLQPADDLESGEWGAPGPHAIGTSALPPHPRPGPPRLPWGDKAPSAEEATRIPGTWKRTPPLYTGKSYLLVQVLVRIGHASQRHGHARLRPACGTERAPA